MDTDGTSFPFQEPYRVRNTILRRNAQTQVNVIRHCVAFEQIYAFLLPQLPKSLSDFPAQFSVKHVLSGLRDKYYLERAVPFYV